MTLAQSETAALEGSQGADGAELSAPIVLESHSGGNGRERQEDSPDLDYVEVVFNHALTVMDDIELGLSRDVIRLDVETLDRVRTTQLDEDELKLANHLITVEAQQRPPGVQFQTLSILNLEPLADNCPPLPDEARPAEVGQNQWLAEYVDYARCVAPMTPDLFHESAGLFLGAVCIARRLKVPMAFGDVFPNLFIAWIAPTTLFTKTTALNVSRNLARGVFPHLLAAQDVTTEALLSDLAGKEPPGIKDLDEKEVEAWRQERAFAAQRGWILDEMSGLLASAGKEYNAGLVETLMRFFDCDPRYTRSTRAQGRIIIKNACLSLIGASTPGAMALHLNSERLWQMGWWPRFSILVPEVQKPAWKLPMEGQNPSSLAQGLRELDGKLESPTWPEPPKAITVTLTKEAMQAWQRFNRVLRYDFVSSDLDERLHGLYGRLPTQVLKVGAILAALDWKQGKAPVITLPHLGQAVDICERWRESAHRALVVASAGEFDRLKTRIIREVAKRGPNGATLRDIYRNMRDKTPNKIQRTVFQLVEVGELESEKSEGQGPLSAKPKRDIK